jgi:Bacterial PH domain
LIACAGLVVSCLAATDPGVGGVSESFVDRWVGAGMLVTTAWVVWHAVARPAVVLGADGLSVRNPVLTYDVPWPAVEECEVDGSGCLSVRTPAGEITAFTYSGSVIAGLFGAPSAIAACDEVERWRAGRPSLKGLPEAGVRRRLSLSLWPLIAGWGLAAALTATWPA